jgi:hypothetical protein
MSTVRVYLRGGLAGVGLLAGWLQPWHVAGKAPGASSATSGAAGSEQAQGCATGGDVLELCLALSPAAKETWVDDVAVEADHDHISFRVCDVAVEARTCSHPPARPFTHPPTHPPALVNQFTHPPLTNHPPFHPTARPTTTRAHPLTASRSLSLACLTSQVRTVCLGQGQGQGKGQRQGGSIDNYG